MCIKRATVGGRKVWVFDPGRFSATVGAVLAVAGLAAAIKVNCNSSTAYARENIIRPEAVEVFEEMHAPFEKRLEAQCQDVRLIRMMVEEMVSPMIKQKCIERLNDTTWRVK